jgi:flagellar biosynthesis protein FlhG
MNYSLERPYIFSFASGKGGAGKSISVVNVAESLNNLGYRVAVLDADLGFSSCGTLLNEYPQGTVSDVKHTRCTTDDIIHTTRSGLSLIIGADEPLADSDSWSPYFDQLDQVILRLYRDHDFILIDTPAGISEVSLWALDRSDLCALLLMDEPTAISDLYRFCKYVLGIDSDFPFAAVVNMCEDDAEAKDVLQRFNHILNHFMKRRLPLLGKVSFDDNIRTSVKEQMPVASIYSKHSAMNDFQVIANALAGFANKQPRAKLA